MERNINQRGGDRGEGTIRMQKEKESEAKHDHPGLMPVADRASIRAVALRSEYRVHFSLLSRIFDQIFASNPSSSSTNQAGAYPGKSSETYRARRCLRHRATSGVSPTLRPRVQTP